MAFNTSTRPERHDGWYLQVGVGTRAATRPGWYGLERHDGSRSARYRSIRA